ncbi:hypothetical protein TM7x_01105 [Candidatus Nanosynbacter lyticus]|jgi:hypothetical protein cdiviTM7_01856|uniref:Uncharacterized protein n=1 Tax=Candidatus Nanosynbacter lyticus TaxID=2093824 RepID=A0A6S4GQX4_9BACT|nr:hypothetical protein [Candidatus Nanosynbacter lyticus]AJA06759.1 hypothetical protein TM7x_01105 [Candidatus Nanosynbacter lyticus]QCT41377.1 hypothetical protein FBF38_01090 [TM7 phylum sp. oral taxon 952]
MMKRNEKERGSVNGWMVGTIGCLILFLIAGSLAIWAYMQYSHEKSNVDSKVAIEVAKGKSEQAESDQKKFSEEAKNPRIEFVGPSEYGRVSFMYPKTWSVYIENDGSNRGDYKAYLNPVAVPSASNKASRFALRLEIINKNLDTVLNDYQSRLKKGELTSSSTEFNGISATRIDGTFEKELRGSVVLMKVRDKTIRFSTDADTFKPDFQTILGTVKIAE